MDTSENNPDDKNNTETLPVFKIVKNSFETANTLVSTIFLFVKRTCLLLSVLLFVIFVYQACYTLFFIDTISDGRMLVLLLSGLASIFLLFIPYQSDFTATWQDRKVTFLGKEIEYQQADKHVSQVPYTKEVAWLKFEYEVSYLIWITIILLTILLFFKYA